MPAVTACLACRALKAKCRRGDVHESCLRCTRLGIECESIPRKLGRRLGSKNRSRPKSASESQSSPPGAAGPSSSKRLNIAIRSPSPRRRSIFRHDYDDEMQREEEITRQPTPLSQHQHQQQQNGGGGSQPWSNMLNVLAKVADEMPPNPVPYSPENSMYPFDRRKFLDLYRQASRTLDPDPYMGMAVLEQGLDLLLNNDPGEQSTRILPGEEIVYSRVDQPRRDLLPEWDVLTIGLLSETEVEDLLDVYWSRCNPIIRLLDPFIYTLQYMRATSCLLLSSVLQVAAQCLPVSRHSASLVSRLDQHLDHLFAEVSRRGLQSLEICQGLMIFSTYMRANKQHQTWQFISRVMGMAIELRLDINASPAWHATEPMHSHLRASVKRRNIQRFWLCLSEWDRRLAFIRGRRPMLRDTVLTAADSLRIWWCEPEALECDVMTCAAVSLRGPVGVVQRDMQRAMATHKPLPFEKHLANVDREMNDWRSEWYSRLSRDDQQRIDHDIRAARFVLLMTPYDNRLGNEGMPGFARDECLVAALEVCKNAIPLLGGRHARLPVQNVTAARLYLLGYTSLCALRIMDASSGDEDRPNMDVELFHLSILSALADRLCQLNVHQNVALIASVLGRRLLHACRKVVTRTFSRESASTSSLNTNDHSTGLNNNGFIDNLDSTTPLLGDLGSLTGGLVSQDVEFSFDFGHMGELFHLFDNNDFSSYTQAPI
ncbi:uncharacterized protein IL334_003334 [Kwoniella shivajii]|uniref:Zn(2)-C6 fungal-type domain-containing protein n=1 Tax=Kwoniella shivajii TaxID=564305 RepID=A0ABZ1CYZ8_9TREE|nr:hypothetical protein IL334_003334 [Kwoniella shivajii]